MREISFAVEGVEGEFVADYDELTSYRTNKQFANAANDTAGMFSAFERVFAGRDEEYVERVGGSVSDVYTLMEAAFEAAKAKNSQASSRTSSSTEAK